MKQSLRSLVKNSLSVNLIVYDFFLSNCYRTYNKKLLYMIQQLNRIDSILNYNEFRDAMISTKFPSISGTYTIKRSYSENTLYGYASSMMQYAGLSNEELFYFPLLLHGVPYNDDFDTSRFGFHNSFIFQGKADTEKVLKRYPSKIIYIVGPYIYYSDDYYDDAKIRDIKNSWGRTALLFLNHSVEGLSAKLQIDKKIKFIKDNIKSQYDTYLVCVYCMDAEQIQSENINSEQIKLVSAGYKLDPMFSSRLKTILSLSDDVFFDGFSSSIGYAYLLKKGVYSIGPSNNNGNKNRINTFNSLFCTNSINTDEERRIFVENYWGISEIKTKEEIKNIYYENKNRIKNRIGFFC